MRGHFRRFQWFIMVATIALFCAASDVSRAQQVQCFSLEFFYDSGVNDAAELQLALKEFAANRTGIALHFRDVHDNMDAKKRIDEIAKYFQLPEVKLPAIYGLKNVMADLTTIKQLQNCLEKILTLTAYVRDGCPHCSAARAFFSKYESRYPALKVVYREVVTDRTAKDEMEELTRRYKQQAASLPVVHYCNGLTIGFDRDSTTGQRILQTLDYWSKACPAEKKEQLNHQAVWTASPPHSTSMRSPMPASVLLTGLLFADPNPPAELRANADLLELRSPSDGVAAPLPASQTDSPLPPPGDPPPMPVDNLPIPGNDAPPPLPPEGDDAPLDLSAEQLDDDSADLPIFGRLNASEVGMPAFTIAIGLVDGFNPCAMWVLLLLLSLLVNLKSRSKMFAIAGVFVLISGAAYFAFMAAWLNVFVFLGYLRGVQITLGVLGIAVGGIHIKDFFAFKKGVSLSVPESAKPRVYEWARRIVTAETMWVALAGAIVLAVLVNIVELLCTAGLPALYTNVLMMQGYSAAKNYAYLTLYAVAYMFDDSLMVLIAVVTLGRRKLQEKEGRWLKLISGMLIVALGITMIFKPEWLI